MHLPERRSSDGLAVDPVEECLGSGAEAIDESLDNLAGYYEAGLRSLGLVWSRPNVFARCWLLR